MSVSALDKYDPRTVLAVTRYRALNELKFFTRHMFKHMENRRFREAKHADIIIDALERVMSGKCKRLIINIAPRFGKTELAVKYFIGHCLAANPSAKFIHLSYSNSLALDNSEHIRDMVASEEYQRLFPNVQIKKDSNAKNKWYTTEGGGVYAASASGQVTGFGAGRVDEDPRDMTPAEEDELQAQIDDLIGSVPGVHLIETKQKFGGAIIIDDPIKPDDADSEVRRERVNNRFDSTIRSRVNSETNTPIILIMQRLHPQDLAGYLQLQEPDKWEVISLPVLCDDGTPLCEWKMDLEQIEEKRKANELVFERQYMQNPKPREGLMFPEDELKFADMSQVDLSAAEFRLAPVDMADGGNDFLSMPMLYLIGNKVYVPDVIHNQANTVINEPVMIRKVIENEINWVEIEANGGYSTFVSAFRSKVTMQPVDGGHGYSNCTIRGVNAQGNKHTRIFAESGFIIENFIFDQAYYNKPEYRAFMQCLCGYNKIQEGMSKNKHDDAPDVAAMGAKFFRKMFPQLWMPKKLANV